MTEQLAPLANFFEESARQPWGEKLTGTALSLPEEYRRIKLKGNLYVEYLQAGTTNTKEGNTPNKNHVVFQVPFDEDFEVKDDGKLVTTLGARISMDLTGEDDLLEGIDKDHVSSFFCLSLDFADLTILGPCSSRAHISTWRRARTTTLAHFMSSSLSTTGGPWLPTRSRLSPSSTSPRLVNLSILLPARISTKCLSSVMAPLGRAVGILCALNSLIPIPPAALTSSFASHSFIFFASLLVSCNSMQTFLQLRLANKVAETDQSGQTLKVNIPRVHQKGNTGSRPKLIDRGKFFDYVSIFPDDIEDAHEPESVNT